MVWMWDMKQMFDKYKLLQEKLKNLIIRARQDWVIIDISGESKVKDVTIEDETLLSVDKKETLENAIKAAFEKWQNKVQEIAMQKTKEILWFDPNDLMGMMGWWWGGGAWGMPPMMH